MSKSKILISEESTIENTPYGELIQLFNKHLSEVEFPGVSALSLSDLGSKVQEAHNNVVTLETQLTEALKARTQIEEALVQQSKSAIGYAKVYSTDDDKLSEALNSIQIGKKRKSESPNTAKRTRKKKTLKTEQADLPLDTSKAN